MKVTLALTNDFRINKALSIIANAAIKAFLLFGVFTGAETVRGIFWRLAGISTVVAVMVVVIL